MHARYTQNHMNTTLQKKTKAELISAYEDLLAKQKELESRAQQTFAPERTKTIERVKEVAAPDTLQKTVAALNTAASGAIGEFAKSFETQMRRFEELEKASNEVEARLALLRDLELGAEAGTQLITALESERAQLEHEISTKRRDWAREQEEAEYRAKTDRGRADAEANEERKKKELALKEREQTVATREKEIAEQAKRLENYDADVEKEASKRVTDAKKEWEASHTRELFEKDRELELAEKLHELKLKELMDDVKRLESELTAARKDAAEANKRAQDLALKIVEGTSRSRMASVQTNDNAAA